MVNMDGRSVAQLPLPPGFRFSPTDEELVWDYLRKKADSVPFPIPIIAEVDLYKFDPWNLPEKALFGEKEWFFFSPRDRKYPKGTRPNRAAASGYWKATGTDKPIYKNSSHAKVGVKKSLVFYSGKAPKGVKTNWIMHEYRLAEGVAISANHHRRGSLRLDDWVLCRIYEKSTHAQREGYEYDMESMLPSLPEIDDVPRGIISGLQNSVGGTVSPAQQEALDMDSMLADNASENGRLSSLQTVMMTSNSGAILMQHLPTSDAMTDAWEVQQAMASTSSQSLEKARFMQKLASGQALNMPPMTGQFGERSYNPFNFRSDLVDRYNSLPTGRSPISDEESQSTFQSSVYGVESIYAAIGYDHQPDQSTASYATPRLSENSVIPGNFDSFSYGPPGNNLFN